MRLMNYPLQELAVRTFADVFEPSMLDDASFARASIQYSHTAKFNAGW